MSAAGAEARIDSAPVDFDPFAGGEIQLVAPATDAQQEIWLAAQMGEEASCAFNESLGLRLRGTLDVAALHDAVWRLVMRHEALRCVMSPDGESFSVLSNPAGAMRCTDLSGVGAIERTALCDALLREAVTSPFDLVEGPLFRPHLIRLERDEHCLILTAHHIVCDGWSWGTILSDLVALYSSSRQGVEPALAPAESFGAFARTQRTPEASRATSKALDFWMKALAAGSDAAFDLPCEPRPRARTCNAQRLDWRLSAETVAGLKRTGAAHGCTLFTTMLAAFAVFMHRITGQADVYAGITAAGQLSSGQHELVGHCVNLLPLRTSIDGSKTFSEYLPELHRTLLDAYDHQQATFGRILRRLSVPRDAARIPLAPVRFNLGREMPRSTRAQGVEFEMFTNPRVFENFEIFLDAMETEDGLALECYHNTDLFPGAEMRRRMGEFEVLLKAIAANAGQPISTLPLGPESAPGNGAQRDAPADWVSVRGFRCRIGAIEAAVRRCPGVRHAKLAAEGLPGGEQRIVAFVAPEPGRQERLTADDLRRFIGRRLPGYMIPERFASLPEPSSGPDSVPDLISPGNVAARAMEFAAPDALELELIGIWKDLLRVERVDVYDDFFHAGGTSYDVARLSRALERRGHRVPPAVLFRVTTVREIAEVIRASGEACAER